MTILKVFEKQFALMNQYHQIETKVCGELKHPTRITHSHETQNVHCQEHIRLIIWRGIEELREAGREQLNRTAFKVDAFNEELIDALHFFTEANLFCNMNWSDTAMRFLNDRLEHEWVTWGRWRTNEPFNRQLARVVNAYADATYLLKSKPWKQTPKETNWHDFTIKLAQAYEEFIKLLMSRMTYDEAMAIYFGKAEENVKRQRTGY